MSSFCRHFTHHFQTKTARIDYVKGSTPFSSANESVFDRMMDVVRSVAESSRINTGKWIWCEYFKWICHFPTLRHFFFYWDEAFSLFYQYLSSQHLLLWTNTFWSMDSPTFLLLIKFGMKYHFMNYSNKYPDFRYIDHIPVDKHPDVTQLRQHFFF